jgi:hypothetical protein
MKSSVYEQESPTTKTQKNRQGGDKQSQSSGSQGNHEELMKKAEAAEKPGAAHQALKALEGKWKVEVQCWMDESGEAKTSQGEATVRSTFDGRFMEEDFRGNMFGKSFEGRWLLGYDNAKQKFTSVWWDNASTSITMSEGSGSNSNKVITLEGQKQCAATGEVKPLKQVLNLQGNDKRVCEMFVDGQKRMEITYTRQ